MTEQIVARFTAYAAGDEVKVCVRELWTEEATTYEVFVDGGYTSGGAEVFACTSLDVALHFAACEVRIALDGD